MKNMLNRLILITLCISLLLAGCGTKDLTKGKTPKEIVIASSAEMQKLKSYAFTMDMQMGFPNPETQTVVNISISGTGEAVQNPQKAHMKMVTKVMNNELPSEIYVEINSDNIVEYISNPMKNGEWLKMELPVSPEMMKMLDPAKSLEVVQKLLEDAKIVQETEENKVKYVVMEATIKPDAIAEFIPANLPVPQDELSKMLSSLDSISYNMWIRKDNLFTTKIEMDLSNIIKNIMTGQPNLPPEALSLFEEVTAAMSMSYTDFNTSINITIPDDVKNTAQDFTQLIPQAPTT